MQVQDRGSQPIETPPAAEHDASRDGESPDIEEQFEHDGLVIEPEPVASPTIAELQQSLDQARAREKLLNDELKSLYRRLHIELDTTGRSALIVELFNDPRTSFRLLGFELADRDLSASKGLGDPVGLAVRALLLDPDPTIRAKAARLITRLVPPDGMLIITSALVQERNPIAAEPMLMGIARWPNPEAVDSIMSWFLRDDAPLVALCSAAWSMEQEGILDPEADHPLILDRIRDAEPNQLREDGMKLLAKLGSADDLRRLVQLMLSTDPSVVRWAASALVETPRAVEVLAQSAAENEVLYQAAAEAMIKHRATPEGLRRLSELPQNDAVLRNQMLIRMGQAMDREQLGEAVRLSRLAPETAIAILGRLLTTEQPQTTRTAKGVLQLAELQLDAGRPNRVIEAVLALEGAALDPADLRRRNTLRVQALIMLSRFDEAATASLDFAEWERAIGRINDPDLRARVASDLLAREGVELTPEQRRKLRAISGQPDSQAESESDED